MASIIVEPHLRRMLTNISQRNMYSGQPVTAGVMRMLQLEIRKDGGGILAPPWFSVFERGRGKRKSDVDSGLVYKIYAWMAKRNMFHSATPEGKLAEARSLTWYINKYGNKHFRSKVFVDIYTTARQQCIADIYNDYSLAIGKITYQII